MPSYVTYEVAPLRVTPKVGEGALGKWRVCYWTLSGHRAGMQCHTIMHAEQVI
jgi:hypothetical protein